MGYYVFIETCGIPLYSKVAILMANMMMMINYEIFGYPAFRQLPLFSKKHFNGSKAAELPSGKTSNLT